jgi:subtilisin family serine protease
MKPLPLASSFAGRAVRRPSVLACAVVALAGSATAAEAAPIPGQYIVTVKQGQDPKGIARAVQANPKFVYGSAINGFAAALNERQLKALRHNPNVELVEQDGEVAATTIQSMDAAGDPWGLDRIDQVSLPLSKTYMYANTGTGVRAYIIDTGLQVDHPEFTGRAANMFNSTATAAADCHGHGTHVAGTVGGRTFGVAKNTYLRGVKVLDCTGHGSWSGVIAGVDWVKANAIKPAVANMSLGGGASASVDTAVANLVASGVFVAVAAGNDNVDACTQSPARAGTAYTTASSTKTDAKSGFSNWGKCVDGYAPGSSIKSSTLGGGSGWKNGTSMASPHVAGTGALLCSYGASFCTPSSVTNWINSGSTAGVISGNPVGTPNRLLNKRGL